MRLPSLFCIPVAILLQGAPPDLAIPPVDALRSPSGVAHLVIQPGRGGATPAPKDFVRVHFTGWDLEGKAFANTRTQDEAPFLGLERLMPGMRESLLNMTVGEQRRVWLPEALAFAGVKGKPAGMVVMDLELVDLSPPPSQAPADVAAPPPAAQILRSGLAFKILKAGTGTIHPVRSDWVSVHYTGWTTDGKLFDSSLTKGNAVSLQLRNTIEGWIQGIPLMVVGERRRFWIPEKLAYRGASGMPAGMLVFDVELVAISK